MATLRPPRCTDIEVSFPAPHVMLVTLARPKAMNSLLHAQHWQLEALWKWFDDEPSLRAAVITGQGPKAFCAGSDLLELDHVQDTKDRDVSESKPWEHAHPPSGFAGVSRRRGKKPIVAAVNGLALGGGFEIVLNWYGALIRSFIFFLFHNNFHR